MGVVDKQEFVPGGGYVDEIRLALRASLAQELAYRLISWCLAQIGVDD